MAKKRVHEIAKSQGMSSKEVLAKLQAAGLEVKAAASSVEESDALWQQWSIPSPGKPLFEAAVANFSGSSPAEASRLSSCIVASCSP